MRSKHNPTGFIPKKTFLKKLKAMRERLEDGAAIQQLNATLSEDCAPFSLLQGCILENYHYVKAAPQHIGVALTHCTDEKHKKILLDFFVEEHNHEQMILETLVKMGFKEKDVIASHPTVGTLALISLQSDMGRHSSLAYLACRSLNEATKESVRNRREVMRHFAVRYGLKKDTFDPLMLHAEEDLEAGHASLIEKALASSEGVTAADADHVFRWMKDMNEVYDLHAYALLDYYAQPRCLVPRPKVAFTDKSSV